MQWHKRILYHLSIRPQHSSHGEKSCFWEKLTWDKLYFVAGLWQLLWPYIRVGGSMVERFEGQVLDQIVLVQIPARLLVSCVNLKKLLDLLVSLSVKRIVLLIVTS